MCFTSRLLSNTMYGNPCLKPMLLSKQRKEDSKVCRKNSSGQFKCPANEPASIVMAIPWYPKTQSSLLIEPSGNWLENISEQKLNFMKNFTQGLGTSIATFNTTGLHGNQLAAGCPIFFQNELHIFGVHRGNPHYSDVSNSLYSWYFLL